MDVSEILSSNEPLCFKGVLDWKILNWTEEDWREFLQKDDAVYPIRKGSFVCNEEPYWERKSEEEDMKMDQFLQLLFNPDDKILKENWYYFDYKHISEWFKKSMESLGFTWKCVGLDEKTAEDSTIWIGTRGAHTPCHVDTYGCNFVAQLYGRKTWLLFSPSETDNLKPTRVPYEESSIYSDFNYFCGCSQFPDIREAKLITLEPGDVLYVPKRWWHYVQNETSAISINTWVPLESDNAARIEESLVKCFISTFTKSMSEAESQNILNPNEDDLTDFSLDQSIKELNWCLKKVNNISTNEYSNEDGCRKYLLPSLSQEDVKKRMKTMCSKQIKCERASHKSVLACKDIINAFCHPNIIKIVSENLQKNKSLVPS